MSKAFEIEPTDPRTDQLILHLHNKGWLTRSQLNQALGWDVRIIRAVVAATKGEILSGQKGYILTIQATQEDIEKSKAQTRAQIQSEDKKISALTHVQHHGTRRPHLFKEVEPEQTGELNLFPEETSYGHGH